MRHEVISEVETSLNTAGFMQFLRHIAKTEVSELYFKPVPEFPFLEKATVGRLAFGVPGYQGHIWVKEIGEEKEIKRMVLFFDHRSRFLPEEVKKEIREMIYRALQKMGIRFFFFSTKSYKEHIKEFSGYFSSGEIK